MSLPDAWVDRIFAKLTVTYGAAFLRRYDGIPIADVKADWAGTLAGFQQMPDAIRHGLEHLPSDKPPTVLEFRDACRKAPAPALPALPAPKADPAVAAAVRQAFKRPAAVACEKSWAYKLRDREVAGENLTTLQRESWREAIGVYAQEEPTC
jgi:hypothetical protein